MKRIICSITMFLVSISVYGETTRLECIVSGEIRGSFLGKTDPDKSRKIDKETVNVEASATVKEVSSDIYSFTYLFI